MAKTVLIVEDERAIVEILKFNLKREGYETLEALDGQTGLQLAQTDDPDGSRQGEHPPPQHGIRFRAGLRHGKYR